MIRGLMRPLYDAQLPPRIRPCLRQHLTQFRVLHMVRARIGRENAARYESLHRAQIDFLVASQRAFERALRFRERRRIENDHVP
jgi:hypothetical protein